MGILRADLLTHSQLSNTSGSVEFDGTTDFIQVPSGEAWRIGLANVAHKSVTIEWWIYLNTTSGYHNAFDINYTSGLVMEGVNGAYAVYGGGQTLITEGILDAAVANRWYHYALVIHGGPAATPKSIFLYRDGKLSGAGKIDSNVALGSSSNNLSIGARQSNGANSLNGYISNFRWSDEVVYNSEFTVPKFNLKARPSTLLLCCQSSTAVTEAAVSVTGSVTASGNATHSSFNPGLKDDITDTGVVFDGFGSFATSTYMVPPRGKTTERNRGRAAVGGGYDGSSVRAEIEYFNIQSMGTVIDFGNLTTTTFGQKTNAASSTRGIIAVGGRTPTYVNTIEFITIANTSNATDFGDISSTLSSVAASSNQTRGVTFGGRNSTNVMEFITIATTGNASDFGDLTAAKRQGASVSSPTRGIYAGGFDDTNRINNIEFITIASAGNASDFGDLTVIRQEPAGASDNTRGVFAGGYNTTPSATRYNTVDYITIASAGNAIDFGDLPSARDSATGTSNNTRGVFAGFNDGGNTNLMAFVTIQTTGNASDFGDLITKRSGVSNCSDSHGGLS